MNTEQNSEEPKGKSKLALRREHEERVERMRALARYKRMKGGGLTFFVVGNLLIAVNDSPLLVGLNIVVALGGLIAFLYGWKKGREFADPTKAMWPEEAECPHCGNIAELDRAERIEKKYICPTCNRMIEVYKTPSYEDDDEDAIND